MGLRSLLSNKEKYATFLDKESQRAKAVYPSIKEGLTLRTKERRDGQCMLHIRIWSRLEYSLSPLSVCVIRSLRIKNSRHFPTVTAALQKGVS